MIAQRSFLAVMFLVGLAIGGSQLVGQYRTVQQNSPMITCGTGEEIEVVLNGKETFIAHFVVINDRNIVVHLREALAGNASGFTTNEPYRITTRKKRPKDSWPTKGDNRIDGWDGSSSSVNNSPPRTRIEGVYYQQVKKYEMKDGWDVVVDSYWEEDSPETTGTARVSKNGEVTIVAPARKPIIRNANGSIREDAKAEKE